MKHSTTPTTARAFSLVTLTAAALLPCNALQPAHAKLLQWEVTGNVIDLYDPDTIYGDVRVNDPIRGWLYYDTTLAIDSEDPEGTFYSSETSLPGLVMVVENPRNHSELNFSISKESASWFPYGVSVTNDYYDDFLGETTDILTIDYSVDPPSGSFEEFPIVVFYFEGQDPISDTSLPTDIDLQDWPIHEIAIFDLFADEQSTYPEIYAEIHSIQLVEPVTQPGDFNDDGIVDGEDFMIWQRSESPNPLSQSDLADWEANYGTSTSLAATSATVPEPSTVFTMLFGILAIQLSRRAIRS